MNEMSEAEFQYLRKQWPAIKTMMEGTWSEITNVLGSFPEEDIARIILHLIGVTRQVYLWQLLPQWIPNTIRFWLARHWPTALLPEFDRVIEWMKAGAVVEE